MNEYRENPPQTPAEKHARRVQGKLSPKLQKVRAAKILERKILSNLPNGVVAKEFNVSKETVRRALALAEKAEIVVKFEDKLYNELLPLSHDAVAAGLRGDGDVARAKLGLQVMAGTQVLRPNSQRNQIQQAEDDELALYVLAKRKQAALDRQTIEGEITDEANQTANEVEGPRNLLPGAKSREDEPTGQAFNSEAGPEEPQIEA